MTRSTVNTTVSVRDVARVAGVSVGTVSNVLNTPRRVAAPTVARVLAVIDELGFVRNDAARQLRAGQSRTIGLIVLDVGNPFFTALARGADARAGDEGLTVLVANSDERADREATSLDRFEEQRVFGVLISPRHPDLERLRRLRRRGIPVVLVDRSSTDPEISSVAVDDIQGGRLAGRHLLQRGGQRITFVGGPLSIRQVSDRLTGIRNVVRRQRGAVLTVVEMSSLSVLEGQRAGAAIAAAAAAQRPDSVFCANDLMAIGVMQSLRQAGVRVPEDVAVLGYDDIDFAATTEVPLSSIRQPSWELGRTAIELLLRQASTPDAPAEHVSFQPELVTRQSTAGTVPTG